MFRQRRSWYLASTMRRQEFQRPGEAAVGCMLVFNKEDRGSRHLPCSGKSFKGQRKQQKAERLCLTCSAAVNKYNSARLSTLASQARLVPSPKDQEQGLCHDAIAVTLGFCKFIWHLGLGKGSLSDGSPNQIIINPCLATLPERMATILPFLQQSLIMCVFCR